MAKRNCPEKNFVVYAFSGLASTAGLFFRWKNLPPVGDDVRLALDRVLDAGPGLCFSLFWRAVFSALRRAGAGRLICFWRRLALSSRAEGLGLLLCPELGLFVPGCGPASCWRCWWPCCWLGCMPWILSGLLCGAVSEGRSGRTICRALISKGLCLVLLIRSGLRRRCALLPAWAPELCLLFRCLPRRRWELRRRRARRSRCCLPSRRRDTWCRQWPASS